MSMPWSSVEAALARDAGARVPFVVAGHDPPCTVGSVRREHLPALHDWPHGLTALNDGVVLHADASERDTLLSELNRQLRDAGLIVAWRHETYPVHDPESGRLLATFERAAARFWGTLTFGAHCNGYVADAQGRPTHLWLARRSLTKPTDPGMLDNLVGGGVPHGQTPAQTLVREGWEEAGLSPDQMRTVERGRVLRLMRDIPEGLQQEHLHVFDLALPDGLHPRNQDGEVAEWLRLPVAEAVALAAGETMTVDASLATLDFALRHGLLDDAQAQAMRARVGDLVVSPQLADRFFAFNQSETPGQGV